MIEGEVGGDWLAAESDYGFLVKGKNYLSNESFFLVEVHWIGSWLRICSIHQHSSFVFVTSFTLFGNNMKLILNFCSLLMRVDNVLGLSPSRTVFKQCFDSLN
ncbi:unnamed protein product [Lathyrus oleraceus]